MTENNMVSLDKLFNDLKTQINPPKKEPVTITELVQAECFADAEAKFKSMFFGNPRNARETLDEMQKIVRHADVSCFYNIAFAFRDNAALNDIVTPDVLYLEICRHVEYGRTNTLISLLNIFAGHEPNKAILKRAVEETAKREVRNDINPDVDHIVRHGRPENADKLGYFYSLLVNNAEYGESFLKGLREGFSSIAASKPVEYAGFLKHFSDHYRGSTGLFANEDIATAAENLIGRNRFIYIRNNDPDYIKENAEKNNSKYKLCYKWLGELYSAIRGDEEKISSFHSVVEKKAEQLLLSDGAAFNQFIDWCNRAKENNRNSDRMTASLNKGIIKVFNKYADDGEYGKYAALTQNLLWHSTSENLLSYFETDEVEKVGKGLIASGLYDGYCVFVKPFAGKLKFQGVFTGEQVKSVTDSCKDYDRYSSGYARSYSVEDLIHTFAHKKQMLDKIEPGQIEKLVPLLVDIFPTGDNGKTVWAPVRLNDSLADFPVLNFSMPELYEGFLKGMEKASGDTNSVFFARVVECFKPETTVYQRAFKGYTEVLKAEFSDNKECIPEKAAISIKKVIEGVSRNNQERGTVLLVDIQNALMLK